MTYATLMVHLQLGQSNAGLLRIAGDLADRFQASVIGIAAGYPIQIVYGDGYIPGDLIEQDLQEIEKGIKLAESEFRTALGTRVANLEWRSATTIGSMSNYLADEARSADLVITRVNGQASMFDASGSTNVGDLVMQIGRPVLVVPASADTLKLERAIIGWKDTREARRAVLDALPLLKKAAHVTVVEIAAEQELPAARMRLQDVVGWLTRHAVAAEYVATPSIRDDATRLTAIAHERSVDLIVAGAYGHSRLREWVLGGVTRDLLLRADQCSLVSH